MEIKLEKVGKVFLTIEGYMIEIIEYFGANNVTVKFNDKLSTTKEKVKMCHIISGHIKNPNHPSVHGIGCIGQGKYRTKENKKDTVSCIVWRSMLGRCYNKNMQITLPTYVDCSVAEEWHNFQNFAKWYEENYIGGFQLDKDILIKGNKVYSPKTCCFVPQEINTLLIKSNNTRGDLPVGVSRSRNKYATHLYKYGKRKYVGIFNTVQEAFQAYKTAKEQHIKEVTNKWKDLINPIVYQALINYKVEITD